MKSNQFKIELYHDGKVGYFYDISENQWYILERNTLKYRRQSQKLLVNSSAFSLIIAIFSVVINRWYILNSNFYPAKLQIYSSPRPHFFQKIITFAPQNG